MANLSVNFLASFNPTRVVKHVLAVSSTADRSFAPLRLIFTACKVVEPDWVAAALSNLKPQSDAPSTVDFLLPSTQEGNPFVKFVVAVLPSACSRHNTATNAHELSKLVKANKGSADVVVVLSPSSEEHAFAQACAASRVFPLFNMKTSKGTPATPPSVDLLLDTGSHQSEGLLTNIRSNVENIRLAQLLVDMPPNLLNVDTYISEVRNVASKLDCSMTVIQGADLEAQGFGGIFNVGKASEHPPALVVLSHIPKGVDPAAKSICMVGKGIVYDTGGLSIKTPTSFMAGMKMDMGGSAAVLGSFAAALTSGTPLTAPLHAIMCLAENSVDERSLRPDDIITMLSGKTVEVNNTDAEGRLVLADGCFYAASRLNARVIVDIATLTGAQLIATGKRFAALYCNDDELEALATQVGRETGDLTFPLPYCPEYFKNEFKSQVTYRVASPTLRVEPELSQLMPYRALYCASYRNLLFCTLCCRWRT
jgi:probable aminopeptidase NPEPL1